LWTIIGDNFSFKEADLISYFLGNFIPFVLAAGIVATIYVAIRYELNRTYSQIPKTSETPGTAPSRGASSPSPPVRAPLPSETAIKRDRASLVAPSVTAELNPPASTSATKRESPIITEPKATKSCPLAGLDLSALYDVDKENGTVLLKFRPDGGNVPQKVIELVLLGNKIILDLEETPLAATHYAVQKANIFSGFGDHYAHVAMAMGGNAAVIAAGKGMGSRILKVGLSKGGMLRLAPEIRESVAEVAADLIRRA
jgi:hypothetical protein